MTDEPLHPRLEGVVPPAPPARLEAAALGAAERSWETGADPWTRIWESRALRLAWAAAVLALIAGHLWLPRPAGRSGPRSTLATHGGPDLAPLVDPIPLRVTPLVWLGEGFARAPSGRSSQELSDPNRENS